MKECFLKTKIKVMQFQFIKKILLPIFSKVFEGIVFNSLYNYLMQNKLLTHCQSGFIPGDSCVAQLKLITVLIAIYPTDMIGTFLDISKAFDKVWHEGLIFKSKTYGVDGNLLKVLENYLTGRQQRVLFK